MNYRNFHDLNKDIRLNFQKISELDIDVVVGLPRSGMTPAYMIALLLNVGCTDFDSFLENKPLKKGKTRHAKNEIHNPQDAERILIVDDSVNTGLSMKDAIDQLPASIAGRVTTMAVYSGSRLPSHVDFYLKYIGQPHLFEWNIFGHHILKDACLDIDGVLCVDPTEEQNDDGPKYREFILNAEPKFLPSSKVHALVTSRLEKYRPETEAWMKKHGVEYEHLIMLDLSSQEERRQLKCHGKHKSSYYKSSPAEFFIESETFQAREICMLSGKPVYCTGDNKMYNADYLKIAANNPRYFKHRFSDLRLNSKEFIKSLIKKLIGYRESYS